jgi:hypothetical protein
MAKHRPDPSAGQIPLHILRPELADEEERHPDDAAGDNKKIAPAILLFVEERLGQEDIDGRGVLQKDRVGGARQHRRAHEEVEQRGVEDGGDERDEVEAKPLAARQEHHGRRRKQRTRAGECCVGERAPLDEQSARAPQQHGDDDEPDGRDCAHPAFVLMRLPVRRCRHQFAERNSGTAEVSIEMKAGG